MSKKILRMICNLEARLRQVDFLITVVSLGRGGRRRREHEEIGRAEQGILGEGEGP